MKVFIVYCHPSEDSFTRHVRDAFIKDITDSGNEYILSDLYKMDFKTDMTEAEYLRDAYYNEEPALAPDVLAEQAKKALENASLNVKKTKGIILQTDLGSQYTSNIFEEYLAKLKNRHSYSRKGCPYDNSCIESFHLILKKEEVNLKKYKDFKDAYNAIFEYIEAWYNRERIHSCLNYRTPDEVYSENKNSFVA